MAKYNICIDSAGNPNPATLNCKTGDRIEWKNDSSTEISAFTLPTCVAPQNSPAPVAAGAKTRSYTVNNGVRGAFAYSYDWTAPEGDTRGGTIDVS